MALLQPACAFYYSVDDRITYASVLKWTDASMFCRLPDECDRNAFDVSIHAHQLPKLEKLVLIAATAKQKLPRFSLSAQHNL